MPFSGKVPLLSKSFGLEQQFLRSYYCKEHHPRAHLQDLRHAGMLMMAMVLALYYSLAALLVVDFLSPENCLMDSMSGISSDARLRPMSQHEWRFTLATETLPRQSLGLM